MKVPSKITIPIKILNKKFASNLNIVSDILDAHEGCLIYVTFHKRRNTRSHRQLRYYFGVIIPIFQNCIREEWGEIWTIEKTHEFLKTNCNYEELVNEETGEILRRTKSTSENDTGEQENFYSKCRKLCLDFFNTVIPLPNENLEIKFE